MYNPRRNARKSALSSLAKFSRSADVTGISVESHFGVRVYPPNSTSLDPVESAQSRVLELHLKVKSPIKTELNRLSFCSYP